MSNRFTKALSSLAIALVCHSCIGWNHLPLIPIRFVFTASPFHNWCWALGKPPGCLCCKEKNPHFLDLFYAKSIIETGGNTAKKKNKKKKNCSFINGLPSQVLYPFAFHDCFRNQALLSVHRAKLQVRCANGCGVGCPRLTCRPSSQGKKAILQGQLWLSKPGSIDIKKTLYDHLPDIPWIMSAKLQDPHGCHGL